MALNPTQAAQTAFESLSFFILTGLPQGAEAGIDGSIWQVNSFNGFKLIPPGLHLVVFSGAPSSTDTPATTSGGIGIRHCIFRYFSTGETVVEQWDNAREKFTLASSERAAKRRRIADGDEAQGTVVSREYLKGLDKSLAAYPSGLDKTWKPLINFVSKATLARVVGLDPSGNAVADAVMGSTADEEELKAAGGRQTWGKTREKNVETDLDEGEHEGELLSFVQFDLKRSWPTGAVGESLTRWSKDKGWLLSQVVNEQLGGDVRELLAELQLSFVLFTLVHNFSSLAVYRNILALLSRSSIILLPPNLSQPPSPSLLTTQVLPLYVSFLTLFQTHLLTLPLDFFSTGIPGLDLFLLAELDELRASLSDAASPWAAVSGPAGEVWKALVTRWNAVAGVAMERFGWDLGAVRGTLGRGWEAREAAGDGDEVAIEDLEEGEDAPVIVEL